MQTKRIILFALSTIIGVAGTAGTILAFGTTPQKFAYSNIALLFISIFSIVGIWLDYFLDTKILKS